MNEFFVNDEADEYSKDDEQPSLRSGYLSYQAHLHDLYYSDNPESSSLLEQQQQQQYSSNDSQISGLTKEEFIEQQLAGLKVSKTSSLSSKNDTRNSSTRPTIQNYAVPSQGRDQELPSRIATDSGKDGESPTSNRQTSLLSAIAPQSSRQLVASASGSHRPLVDGQQEQRQDHVRLRQALHTQNVALYGRESETRQWQGILRNQQQSLHGDASTTTATTTTSRRGLRQLVLLSGPSGCGKSRLLQEWTKNTTSKTMMYTMGGKFDQNPNTNLPYSGMALAVEKFLASLLMRQVASHIPWVSDQNEANDGAATKTTIPAQQHLRISTGPTTTKNSRNQDENDKAVSFQGREESDEKTEIGLTSYHQVSCHLQEALAEEESKRLVEFMPILEGMLLSSLSTKNRISHSEEKTQPQHAHEDTDLFAKKCVQFQHAFKKFLRLLAQLASPLPLVLTLDDLQWADIPSLELIKAIVTDTENARGLIVIGCFRNDNIRRNAVQQKQDPLSSVQELEETSNYGADSVTKMNLDNLSVTNVHAMIDDMMRLPKNLPDDDSHNDSDEYLELSRLVHKKTLGNPLFVVQYVEFLVHSGLIQLSSNSGERFGWKWNCQEIDQATMATENVVDVMVNKLQTLPPGITRLLPLISSLGFSFTKAIFSRVITQFNQPQSDGPAKISFSPEAFAERCIQEGLIEEYGADWYRWTHDKLQEASMSLVEEGETLSSLQHRLGIFLLDSMTQDELEGVLFVVTDLLNKGSQVRDRELNADRLRMTELAHLNLRAGRKAIESASFVPASLYLTKGIDLLPTNDRWKDDYYELSLELYSTAAQAAYSSGNFNTLEERCNEVLSQTHRPLLDKQRAYNALLDSIAAQDRMGEAASLCMDVLAKLGCTFPKRGHAVCTVAGLLRTELTLKNRTAAQISKYTTMTDPSKIWAMKLLDKLFTFLYQDKSDMVPLAVLKSLRWTINYGVCDLTMPNFASVGFMLAAFLGDFKGGQVYGKRALELLEQRQGDESSENIKSRTLLIAYGSLLHWTTPFGECLAPLLEGYHVGLKMGDVESGLWCILFYLWFSLFLGTPLDSIVEDLRLYSMQMKRFKQKKHESWTLITLQAVLNLIGIGENTNKSHLIGEATSEIELMKQSEQVHILKPALKLFQMYAMFYFGQHEAVVEMIEANGDAYFEKAIPGIGALVVNAYHSAISCLTMARNTGKKKYKKMARKLTNKIKAWVDKGNPNVIHYKALLEAEWSTFHKHRKHEAIHKYEVAILMAGGRSKEMLVQDRALCHERCGDFMAFIGKDKEATYHMKKAYSLYEEWGAFAVASRLKEEHPNIFRDDSVLPPIEIRISKSD